MLNKHLGVLLCIGLLIGLDVFIRFKIYNKPRHNETANNGQVTIGHKCHIPGPFLALEEVVFQKDKYSGQRVKIICYFDSGFEGASILNVPRNLPGYLDPKTSLYTPVGCSMLAQFSDNACVEMSRSRFFDFESHGNVLALVEGIVHDSGYGEVGDVLETAEYIEIERVSIISQIIPEELINKECHCTEPVNGPKP